MLKFQNFRRTHVMRFTQLLMKTQTLQISFRPINRPLSTGIFFYEAIFPATKCGLKSNAIYTADWHLL